MTSILNSPFVKHAPYREIPISLVLEGVPALAGEGFKSSVSRRETPPLTKEE